MSVVAAMLKFTMPEQIHCTFILGQELFNCIIWTSIGIKLFAPKQNLYSYQSHNHLLCQCQDSLVAHKATDPFP